MALIRDYDLVGGITVSNAYFVITNLNASKKLLDIIPPAQEGDDPTTQISQKWSCHIAISVFKDKATREAGGDPLAFISSATPNMPVTTDFEYDPSGALPIVQGYIFLMGQDYFSGATSDADS